MIGAAVAALLILAPAAPPAAPSTVDVVPALTSTPFAAAPGRPVSHAITLRVPDCRAAYEVLRGRGAEFLTPPVARSWEVRCFFRDPDGHLFEISEAR